jgi:hypothetical protein
MMRVPEILAIFLKLRDLTMGRLGKEEWVSEEQ